MEKPRHRSKSRLSPFLAGAMLGAVLTGAAMLWFPRGAALPEPVDAKSGSASAPAPCPEALPAEATQPRKPGDFAFYGVLEKVPVAPARPDLDQAPMPPPLGRAPAPPAATPDKVVASLQPAAPAATVPTPFYLQLASFKTAADADAFKARIALTGVEVGVVATEIPEKGSFYRVRIGPFDSQAAADQAKALLSQGGVSAGQALQVR